MKNKYAFLWIPLISAALFAVLTKLFLVFPIMPVQASQESVAIDSAFAGCLTLTLAIFSLVVAATIYSVIQFRATSPGEEGQPFHHSRGWWFESAWIGLSVVLTFGLAVYGWQELRLVYGSPEADLDIQVRAEQFTWEFFYPKFNQTASRLYLPKGKRARISLTSKDVVHSFWIPEFRMKQDAVPGKITTILLTPTREGNYTLLCNQLCGRDHTDMMGLVEVVDDLAFAKKFTSQGESW